MSFSLPAIRRTLSCVLAALVAVALVAGPQAASASAARSCPGADLAPTDANLAKVRTATLCLLNRERTKRGLPKLRAQPSLAAAARKYARTMVRDRFFDHVSPGGSTMVNRVKATSYLHAVRRSWSLGENIAWGVGELATARQTHVAWMNSPGHRRNILDREFREIGIGIAPGVPVEGAVASSSGATYVTEFGRRR